MLNGDGNENSKQSVGLKLAKKTNFTRVAHFFSYTLFSRFLFLFFFFARLQLETS